MPAPDQNTNTGTSTSTPLAGSQLETSAKAVKTEAAQKQAAQPTLSSQMAQDASQADITNEDLFPGMNQKINVGNFSSPVLGSRPIFVAAGQYVPYNILNKKEEAIAKAAKKRAERQAKFDPGKAKQLTNQLYQRGLNDRFNEMNSDFISTAQKMYPDNWDVMLGDQGSELGRAYAQQKSNFDVLATESNVIFDKAAQVIADKEKGGDTIHSAESQELAYNLDSKMGAAAEGKSLEDLRPYVDKFNGSFDLDKHLAKNNIVTQMKADIQADLAPGGGGMTVETIADYTERIEAYAESETATPAGRYYNDNIIKKQDIIDRLTGLLGTQEKLTHKYKPVPAHIGKGVKRKELTDRRYKTLKTISKDIDSPLAQRTLLGLIGARISDGTATDVEVLDDKVFQPSDNVASGLVDFYNENKDKKTKYLKNSVFNDGAKDELNRLLKENKADITISSVKLDEKDNSKYIIKDNFGTEHTVDASTDDGGLSSIQDFIIANTLGEDVVPLKGKRLIKFDIAKGRKIKQKYFSSDDPSLFNLLNNVLNTDKGEDLQVQQEELDIRREADPDFAEAKPSHLTKQNMKNKADAELKKKKVKEEEKKESEEYIDDADKPYPPHVDESDDEIMRSSDFELLQLDYPKVDTKHIVHVLKEGYSDNKTESYLKSKSDFHIATQAKALKELKASAGYDELVKKNMKASGKTRKEVEALIAKQYKK